MRLIFKLFALSLLATLVAPLYAQEEEETSGPWPAIAKPETTDETSLKIINLHMKARGGREALSDVKTLHCEGELVEGQKDYALTVTFGAPASIKVVSDRFFKGYNYITVSGTDGSNAWAQETDPKRKNPRKVTGLDKQLLELDALLPFLLLDPDSAGHVFAYRGEEKFAQRPVYTVHGWLKNGLQIEVLFDSESFQVINYRHLYLIGDEQVVIDRVPTGLTRINDTWWEKGYRYLVLGKSFREVTYFKMQGASTVETEAFMEPPTRERWLRSAP